MSRTQRFRKNAGILTLGTLCLPGGLYTAKATTEYPSPENFNQPQIKEVRTNAELTRVQARSPLPPPPEGHQQTDTRLEVQATLTTPSPAAVTNLRNLALANTRVQAALGERFRFLVADSVAPPKHTPAPSHPPTTLLRYFSYTHNRVIDVYLVENQVVEIQRQRYGFQPAEGRKEVADAAALVRADPRYKTAVADLVVRGLVTESNNQHRHLYLLFYREEDKPPPVFHATVDMTTQRVVSAGPIPHSPP